MTLRPSVCIDAVFEGRDEIDALNSIKQLGFDAFEFWMWWEKDLPAIVAAKNELGLQVAACCTKFVSLVDPAKRSEYLEGVRESIEAAQQLGCPTLISQVGDFLPDVPREKQQASLVAGLQESARLLEGTGVTLAIEPLNELVDHPGYYLIRSNEAFDIVEKVGSEQIKLTFDIYHQQISEGNVISNLVENIDKIAHFHAAGNPGRHELDHGELSYPAIFQAIGKTSFAGYVGLEYWPKCKVEDGLRRALEWF